MKKVMKMFIFAAILILPAAIFAQGSGSSYPRPSSPSTNSNASNTRSNNFLVKKSITGKILKFKDGVVTIETKKKKTYEVILARKTKFKVGKRKVKADELELSLFEKGSPVKITYQVRADQREIGNKVALQMKFLKTKKKNKPSLTE